MTFSPIFQNLFIAPAMSSGVTVIPWYLSGGISAAQCVAAYSPKGAADYASSKINLVTPGTFNATDGTAAPTWDATNGWTFTTAQFLNVAITTTNETWTLMYRFSGAGAAATFAYAVGAASSTTFSFGYSPNFSNAGQRFFSGAQFLNASTIKTSGIGTVAGKTGYYNGSSVGTIPAGAETANVGWSIGRVRSGSGIAHSCQAMSIYNITLNSTQVGAVYTAMAAL